MTGRDEWPLVVRLSFSSQIDACTWISSSQWLEAYVSFWNYENVTLFWATVVFGHWSQSKPPQAQGTLSSVCAGFRLFKKHHHFCILFTKHFTKKKKTIYQRSWHLTPDHPYKFFKKTKNSIDEIVDL